MQNNPYHLLVVDDHQEIREVLQVLLQSEGYQVTPVSDGLQAIEAIKKTNFDLILLDIMMPGISGIETCQILRQYTKAPVLFLTARSQEEDKKQAYLGGGDDYLVKPFNSTELLLKVGSLLRRYHDYQGGAPSTDRVIHLGNVMVDLDHHQVKKDGNPVELTNKELAILLFLIQQKGAVVNIETIFENVWHEQFFQASANTVMVHMLNLRKKLERDHNNPRIIRTVWGRGYQIEL